jgi:hypothetical protein
MRSVSISYVTFARDLRWLDYSLASYRKYCKGFARTIITVPIQDTGAFMYLEKKYGTADHPVWIRGFIEMPDKGFVHHLAMKMFADVTDPDADYILHMDPDCLWSVWTTPDAYFVAGKPVLVIEPYDVVKLYHPGRYHWKGVTESTLGFGCEFETMCRHPAIHCRELYQAVRAHIEKVYRTPFIDYCMKQKNGFPQSLGEFNTLGSFALENMGERYCFVDCGPERLKHIQELRANSELSFGHPPPHLWQGWSYTGVDKPENQAMINRILS